MRKVAIVALVLFLIPACTSGVSQIKDVAQQACDLYTNLRDDVVALKAIIVLGFDSYPPDVQEKLKKINAKLPQLETIGRASCAFASADQGVSVLREGGISGWDVALKVLKTVAPVVGDLKRAGVI